MPSTEPNAKNNSYNDAESAFSPYKQKGYAEELGATDHPLTDSDSFRAHLDKNGQHDAEVYNWHISKLPDAQIVSMGCHGAISTSITHLCPSAVHVTRQQHDGRCSSPGVGARCRSI